MPTRTTGFPPDRSVPCTAASVLNDDCLATLSIASGLSIDETSAPSVPATVFNDPALAVLAEACESAPRRAPGRLACQPESRVSVMRRLTWFRRYPAVVPAP